MARMSFDVAELHRLWYSGMTNAELCYTLGVARSSLDVLRSRYKLDRRPFERNNKKAEPESPTIEEIEARAAEVRARWSEEEHLRRLCAAGRREWSMPAYAFHRRDHAFSEASH